MFQTHKALIGHPVRIGETLQAGRIVIVCACAFGAAAIAAATVAGAAHVSPQRVTVFGDSQLAGVAMTPDARAMLAQGVDLDLRAAVCRRLVQESCPFQGTRPSTVLDEAQVTDSTLGRTAVILVGYNDFEAEWARSVAAVMRALVAREVTRVLWLTLTERRPDWARMNDTLRAAAKSWPQLEVLDWKDAAAPSWFRDDDIHLTGEGALGLAAYVHAVLLVRGIATPTPSAAPSRVPLRLTIRGTGAVTVEGTTCRRSCSRLVAVGSAVRLVAQAPARSVFDRWGGACAGKRITCVLKVSQSASVVARFQPR